MIKNLEEAKEILKKYNQEHLLSFYDELSEDEKKALVDQICSIDFKEIFDLYEASKDERMISIEKLEPLSYTEKANFSEEEIENFTKIGEDCIKSNEFAVVTLAGGQRK